LGVEPFLTTLRDGASRDVFNQYARADPALDVADAADLRLANLRRYIEAFRGARYLLVGEAAGYAACRFSGVPFTDETQLVGRNPLAWGGQREGFRRCSRDERPLLREASAAVVWGALGTRLDVALWNVVPWHPSGDRGPLSNTHPSGPARASGLKLLRLALDTIWPCAEPIAVGRVAEWALRDLGIARPMYLRHPGHGGSAAFRAGLEAYAPPISSSSARSQSSAVGFSLAR
jgi:hypothetical protein